ncbi:MAG: ABC transporter permease [Ilumatobacteraceae bacterium]
MVEGLAGEAPEYAVTAPRTRRDRRVGIRLAGVWLTVVVAAAVTADLLPLGDPNKLAIGAKLARPLTAGHLLGTDGLGRDLLSRVVFGARVSLIVAAVSVIVGVLIGGALGVLAGYRGGLVDLVIMGALDVVLAFPALVLLLALVAVVGQSLITISFVVGLLSVPFYARVARATTLQVRSAEYVTAARVLGVRPGRVLLGEVVPQVVLPLFTFATVAMAAVVVLEGSLAYLNLSVAPPTPTWGLIIAEGKRHLREAPHVVAVPASTLFLTVLSLNVLGQAGRARVSDRGAMS